MEDVQPVVEKENALPEPAEHKARKIHITMRIERDVLTKIEDLRGTYKIEGWDENPYFKKDRTAIINDLLRKGLATLGI